MNAARAKPVSEIQHVLQVQRDTSSAVQAVQMDVNHLSKTVDKLVELQEETTKLHAKLAGYGERLDRALSDVSGVDSKLTRAIEKLTESIEKDRANNNEIADTVKSYRFGLRIMYVVGGVIVALLVTLASMQVTALTGDIAEVRAAAAVNSNRIEVLDAKNERLRTEDKLIEGEHNDRLVRLERKGDEVAP